MKSFLVFFGILALMWSCKSNNCCGGINKYLVKVDTSKPYKVKGKYCITTHDTIMENDMSIISIRGFDRKTGKGIREGIVWFDNGIDTVKVLFDGGIGSKKLPAGIYVIDFSNSNIDDDVLGLRMKRIELPKNTKMEINVYLGSIVQW